MLCPVEVFFRSHFAWTTTRGLVGFNPNWALVRVRSMICSRLHWCTDKDHPRALFTPFPSKWTYSISITVENLLPGSVFFWNNCDLACQGRKIARYNLVLLNQTTGPALNSFHLLTLLQLPLIEVGNAVKADCYSIASYP